jgi:hypothetical protein
MVGSGKSHKKGGASAAIKKYKRARKTANRKKDLDQIQDELVDPNFKLPIDEDLPGEFCRCGAARSHHTHPQLLSLLFSARHPRAAQDSLLDAQLVVSLSLTRTHTHTHTHTRTLLEFTCNNNNTLSPHSGMGQFYCLYCDEYYISADVLTQHQKSKKHKRRVKWSQEKPYSQAEADAAAGMAPPKKT